MLKLDPLQNTKNKRTKSSFDGVYFFADPNAPGHMAQDWFELKGEEYENQTKIGGTPLGDMFHVSFIGRDGLGFSTIEQSFEAIFSDVDSYLKGLAGSNVYGVILRKTDKSTKWMEDYRMGVSKNVKIQKLYNIAKSIQQREMKKQGDTNDV